MARTVVSENKVPAFDETPTVILIAGDVEFFVEEAAEKGLLA